MSKLTFNPDVVERVLEDLLHAFEENCFANAPPRPNVVESEEVGEFSAAVTSTGGSLRTKAFASAPIHVPNAGDHDKPRHSFKSELTLLRDPNVGTKKLMWWYGADPRSDPHDHPFDFRSAILSGGYTEERWYIKDGIWVREVVEYTAGNVNLVPANVYHNVIEVAPDTVTFLDCGRSRVGNKWGYLDKAALDLEENPKVESVPQFTWQDQSPSDFLEIFKLLNAHSYPEKEQ